MSRRICLLSSSTMWRSSRSSPIWSKTPRSSRRQGPRSASASPATTATSGSRCAITGQGSRPATASGSLSRSSVWRAPVRGPAASGLALRSRNDWSRRTPERSGSTAASARGRASSSPFRGGSVSVSGLRAEPSGARLLVVDDEPSMVRTLRTNLRGHGFQVETAETASDAIASYERRQPDLVVLDLNLPDGDGFEIVRRIRERSATPIIVLSARGGEHDKVNALDLGADDYMTKPFGIDELLARIRVALRHVARPGAGTERRIRSGDLVVDLERREVSIAGRDVHLTPTEYDLLKVFLTNANKVLTDRMLLQHVWGPDYGDESHYLHVYVARLRRKIEGDPQEPKFLTTEPGVGYRFRSEEL